MIIFLFFVSFYLGNVLTTSLVLFLIISIVFLLLVLKRFKRIAFLVSLGGIVFGFGVSFIRISYNKASYTGFVYTVKENYFLLNSQGERLYVYKKGHSYDLGDYLTIEGKKEELDFTTLDSGFDFKDYLNKRGVYHSLAPSNIKVKWHNFIRINKMRESALSHFNSNEKNIVRQLLFSDRDDDATNDTLSNLHLARFMSASGLYVGLFVTIINYLLSLFLKDKHSKLITIVLLSFYVLATLPRFSVFRVFFLLILKWINEFILKKRFSYLEVLGIGGVICLLFDHYLAYQDSFLLGFGIPIVSYLIRDIYPSSKVKNYLCRMLTIYMFFIPFEAHYYQIS